MKTSASRRLLRPLAIAVACAGATSLAGCTACSPTKTSSPVAVSSSATTPTASPVISTSQSPGPSASTISSPTPTASAPAVPTLDPANPSAPPPVPSSVSIPDVEGYTRLETREDGPYQVAAFANTSGQILEVYFSRQPVSVADVQKVVGAVQGAPKMFGQIACMSSTALTACASTSAKYSYFVTSKTIPAEKLAAAVDQVGKLL